MQKWVNIEKAKQKQREVGMEPGYNKILCLHCGYKFHSIMDRNYELIRRFKTTTSSLNDFQID